MVKCQWEKKTNTSIHGVVFKQERKTGVEVTANSELTVVVVLMAHSKLNLQTAMQLLEEFKAFQQTLFLLKWKRFF